MGKRNSSKEIALLGMSVGKARNMLVNRLILDLLRQLEADICYRCHESLTDPDDLSMDHKEPWRGEPTADRYWDVDNVAWSHRKCNKPDRVHRKCAPEGYGWCSYHKGNHRLDEFGKSSVRWSGYSVNCLQAQRELSARSAARNPRFPCPDCGKQMRKRCGGCGYDMPMKDYMALRRKEGVSY